MLESLVREATATEIAGYLKVEEAIKNLTDEQFSLFIEKVGDLCWSYGKERKTAYSRLRSTARKLNVTIPEMRDWYFIDWGK